MGTISEWIAEDVRKFKLVYSLSSCGNHGDVEDNRQLHSPLKGAPSWLFEPTTFDGEKIKYFRYEDKGFFACSSYEPDGKVNEILRFLLKTWYPHPDDGHDLPIFELVGRRELEIDGFSLHRTYATFVSVDPNDYNDYYCCDYHKVFHRLAESKEQGHPVWFYDLLYDAQAFSQCLSFIDFLCGRKIVLV